jgi:predicted nucleotidyltransferase
MMSISENEKKALKALQTELSRDFRIKDFRLFGSKARGEDTPGSDLDVMIVLEDSSPAVEEKIDDLIFDLNLKFDCLITPLYFSSAEIESGPLSESPVYKKALAEGISF